MLYKVALKRQGAASPYCTIEENLDLLVPERINNVPQEWQDKWWAKKTKHIVEPEILAMFSQN